MDWDAEGLLEGLDADERTARAGLLDRLHDQGVPLEELRDAVAEDRLVLLPIERLLGGRYTADEVEEKTGLPAALMLRIRRLGGLPEAGPQDRVFGEEDVDVGRSTQLFLEAGLTEESISEITRVLGEAMARVAASTAGHFVEAFLRPGDSELEVADRFAALAEHLTPALEPVLAAAFKAHLREAVRRGMIGREDRAAGRVDQGQPLAVCFADVVGFTRLGAEVDVEELGHVAGALAKLAAEVTESPVRLVKTIGDAAMLASPEPRPLLDAALALVDAADGEGEHFPQLRAGAALGMALPRAGDWFGRPVNLASRITQVARPGSLLTERELREAGAERYRWSFAGERRLRGLREPVALYRARPASA